MGAIWNSKSRENQTNSLVLVWWRYLSSEAFQDRFVMIFGAISDSTIYPKVITPQALFKKVLFCWVKKTGEEISELDATNKKSQKKEETGLHVIFGQSMNI